MIANLLGLTQIHVFLEGLGCKKGPDCAASHFYEAEVGIYIITIFRINMTKVMRELDRVGAWKTTWDLLHILIDDDIPTFRVDDHAGTHRKPKSRFAGRDADIYLGDDTP